MSNICSCCPWCKTAPPPPSSPSLNYIESKSVIRPSAPDIPAPAKTHSRVLSTMYIKDGKAVVTYRDMTEEEADRKFSRTPEKTQQTVAVKFSRTVSVVDLDPTDPIQQ
jgi:hypothetical protein